MSEKIKDEALETNTEQTTKKVKKDKKDKNKFNTKKLKHGAMATAFTCVFIAVVVLVNVIATVIFDRFPITIDLTENKIYSISEEAEEYVKKIDKKVTVTVLAKKDDFESFGGEYTKSASELLEKYRKTNSNIEVRYIDFLSNPDIMSEYADQSTLGSYDVIFETSSKDSDGNEFKRVKVVGLMDMVNIKDEIYEYYVSAGYDSSAIDSEVQSYVVGYGHSQTFSLYNSYGMLGTSNAESAFVSALMTVADDSAITVTFLNAERNEAELTYFKSLLNANGYIVNEINITTEEIPSDTNVLVMPAPKLDYTTEEIEKVDKFLDNNGELKKNLIYMASIEQGDTPNIDEFLEEYGLKIEKTLIGDAQSSYASDPFKTFQTLVGEYYLNSFDGTENSYYYVPYSRPVTALYEEDGMKVVWKYLASSSKAYEADLEKETVEQNGTLYSFCIGAKCKFTTDDEGNNIQDYSHILAFGTEGFFDDSVLATTQFKNGDLIISMLNEITGKKQDIVLKPKSVNAVTFDITDKQATVLKYTFVFVIPILTLVIGLVVYIRRKNK